MIKNILSLDRVDEYPVYDPSLHVLLRDWCHEYDYEYSNILSFLRRNEIDVFYIGNPYLAGLKFIPEGASQSQSYSYGVRVIRTEDRNWLDKYAKLRGETPFIRDLEVKWIQSESDENMWLLDKNRSPMIHRRGCRYIFKVPVFNLNEVISSDKIPPPIEIVYDNDNGTATVLLYGNHRVNDGPISLNGIYLGIFDLVEGTISNVPGTAERWGTWTKLVSANEADMIIFGKIKRNEVPVVEEEDNSNDFTPVDSSPVDSSPEISSFNVYFKVTDSDFIPMSTIGNNNSIPEEFFREDGRPCIVIASHSNKVRAWGNIKTNYIINGVNLSFTKRLNKPRYEASYGKDDWGKLVAYQVKDGVMFGPPEVNNNNESPIEEEEINLVDKVAKHSVAYDNNDIERAWAELEGGIIPLFADREYIGLPRELWSELLADSTIDKVEYVDESRDCDDFVWMAKGVFSRRYGVNGLGAVLSTSGQHAFVAVLVDDGETNTPEIAFFEPQNDRWTMIGSADEYSLQEGLVIW